LTPEKFRKWRDRITNSGKYNPDPELTINSRVCSKHFLREDYISDENIQDKPDTPGNHILGKDATPSIFKWNDSSGNGCEISRALPFVKKSCVVIDSNERNRNQEIQCSLQDDKLQQEISRKNIIIRQLLQRLSEFELPNSDIDEISTSSQLNSEPMIENDLQEAENTNIESEVVPTLEIISPEELFISKATNTEKMSDRDTPALISTAQQTDSGFMPTCIPVQVIKRAPCHTDLKLPPKKRKLNDWL